MYRAILFITFIIISQPSFALGKLGHQLVCQLAYDHLSSATQQKVDLSLNNMAKDQQALINNYLYQPANATISFAKSCIWADAIKKDKSFDRFKPWHYLNVTRKEKHINEHSCKDNCVSQAIKIHTQALKAETSAWKKTQTLMFLGHWLGDIHQPLHVSYASDWGGNKVKINSPDKKCTNIHWLWDSCLLSREKLTSQLWLTKLTKQWQQAPIKQWQNSEVWQWADESLQIVRQADVGYCHLEQGNCVMSNKQQTAHLYSSTYQTHFSAILQTRMVQAAARLTKLLEQSL
jgi:nuclease S1